MPQSVCRAKIIAADLFLVKLASGLLLAGWGDSAIVGLLPRVGT